MVDNNKITFKEFVRAVPKLSELLFWALAGYVVVVGFVFLGFFAFGLFMTRLFPDTAKVALVSFAEWLSCENPNFGFSNSALIFAMVMIALMTRFVFFVRSITIGVAKDLQKGKKNEV